MTDLKLSKAQLSKIIQSGGLLGSMICKLGKEALAKLAVPLAKYFLPQLSTNVTRPVIDKFEKKKCMKNHKSRKIIHFINFK